MREKITFLIGKKLMKLSNIRICIIDDKYSIYFSEEKVSLLEFAGYKVERIEYIDSRDTLDRLLMSPPDILVLDIKGIADPSLAKDGFDLATIFNKETKSYIVVTSEDLYQLENIRRNYDDVLPRELSAVELYEHMEKMIKKMIELKYNFYQGVTLKIGMKLIKKSALYNMWDN
jgi:hypothetical protein